MWIDKDTKIFCSFAETAGNNGCKMFNAAFSYYRMNALYKSFSVYNIEYAVKSAKTLGFSGFAITMPFKKDVIQYVNELSEEVKEIGSANTVINNGGTLKAYNTDYLAAKELLYHNSSGIYKHNKLIILGNGGYSAAVQYAAKLLKLEFKIITRTEWNEIDKIRDSIIFNCTPVTDIGVHSSNKYIDCIVTTETGKRLSAIQAEHQFKLYTGMKFPIK